MVQEHPETKHYLVLYWRVEISREQVMVEVFQSERAPRYQLGNVVVPLLQHLLHDLLGLRDRRAAVALNILQKVPELLGGHVGPSLGVLSEVFRHVRRWLSLCDPELASEAHAHPVTPHFRQNRTGASQRNTAKTERERGLQSS